MKSDALIRGLVAAVYCAVAFSLTLALARELWREAFPIFLAVTVIMTILTFASFSGFIPVKKESQDD